MIYIISRIHKDCPCTVEANNEQEAIDKAKIAMSDGWAGKTEYVVEEINE